MSKETKQDEFKIVLEDGKEVNFDDFQAQQLQAAKNHFSTELNSSLKEEKEDA